MVRGGYGRPSLWVHGNRPCTLGEGDTMHNPGTHNPAIVCASCPPRQAADLMSEARAWLADLEWVDEPDFASMTDEQIRRGINRHYDGGWSGFVADGA